MREHSKLMEDDEARIALGKYFKYTSHYIVVASDYMRPDQVRVERRSPIARVYALEQA